MDARPSGLRPSVRVLSFHADYRCRHRGRCCTSGWPIAVEPGQVTALRGAGLMEPGEGSTGPTLLPLVGGRCAMHQLHGEGGCRIQHALGHDALPVACRQFPRQSLRDPRGVAITLSHYCPTAASLLEAAPAPLRIVDDAPAFPAGGKYVGFTADFALPPLLHPRLAMDWESWWTFEAQAVALFAEDSDPLDRLALAVEHTRAWTVGRSALLPHVHEAYSRARAAAMAPRSGWAARIADRVNDAVESVPGEWRPAAQRAVSSRGDHPVSDRVERRYLAAHAFANWAAHQGEGLRTWFRAVESAACLLSHTADPGHADLILRHLADPGELISRWGRLERVPVT